MMNDVIPLEGRTARGFKTSEDMWAILEEWAQQNKYKLLESYETGRVYKKGGVGVLPMMLKIETAPYGYQLEAWVSVPRINQILSFGTLPTEMVIDSGPKLAFLPRNKARKDVNKLLERMGLPLID